MGSVHGDKPFAGMAEGWFAWLCSSPDAAPVLLGLWARALGLLFAWACGILLPQVAALAGRRGIAPVQTRVQRIRTDFSRVEGMLRFPSLLHLFGSLPPHLFDGVMVALLCVGTLSGFLTFLGAVDSRVSLAVCWAVVLSLPNVMHMIVYPWDCLLSEAGFISLFLPSLLPLTAGVGLREPAVPLVAFSLRWLLFRLMFGFGKMKFSGASTKEFSYLKSFLVNQPMPSVIGWVLHSMPLLVHKAGLLAFFLSEIVVPFGVVLFSGPVRVTCAIVTIVLQVHIHAAGNFGFFNLASALLCIPSLNGAGGLADTTLTITLGAPVTHLILGALLPLSCLFLLFNSWVGQVSAVRLLKELPAAAGACSTCLRSC